MILNIRPESPPDKDAIESVIAAAFLDAPHTSHTEQLIVSALRDAGQLTLSLVAETHGNIVGHIALSPVTIADGSCGWYGLGPLAVVPAHQNQGIGTKLVTQALNQLRLLGASGCVVLGEPTYYRRFGFTARSLILPDVPAEYFQAICFQGSMPTGIVTYHNAFLL